MPTPEELEQEEKKMRKLRILVDFTTAVLYQGKLSLPEMIQLVKATRQNVLELFPDKGDTFDLIYKPRFERIIKERLERN